MEHTPLLRRRILHLAGPLRLLLLAAPIAILHDSILILPLHSLPPTRTTDACSLALEQLMSPFEMRHDDTATRFHETAEVRRFTIVRPTTLQDLIADLRHKQLQQLIPPLVLRDMGWQRLTQLHHRLQVNLSKREASVVRTQSVDEVITEGFIVECVAEQIGFDDEVQVGEVEGLGVQPLHVLLEGVGVDVGEVNLVVGGGWRGVFVVGEENGLGVAADGSNAAATATAGVGVVAGAGIGLVVEFGAEEGGFVAEEGGVDVVVDAAGWGADCDADDGGGGVSEKVRWSCEEGW
jgi:hypothetical protein